MSLFSIFGGAKKDDKVRTMLDDGAIILDVRTKAEFASGHVKGSKNIPVQVIQQNISTIKGWNKPIVACCQSGMRSGSATSILKGAGIDCVNGGPWTRVQNALS